MTLRQLTISLLLLSLASATINQTDVNDTIAVVDQLDPDRLKGVWFNAIVSQFTPETCTLYECQLHFNIFITDDCLFILQEYLPRGREGKVMRFLLKIPFQSDRSTESATKCSSTQQKCSGPPSYLHRIQAGLIIVIMKPKSHPPSNRQLLCRGRIRSISTWKRKVCS